MEIFICDYLSHVLFNPRPQTVSGFTAFDNEKNQRFGLSNETDDMGVVHRANLRYIEQKTAHFACHFPFDVHNKTAHKNATFF